MQRALCYRKSLPLRLHSVPVRYATHRSFDRPLSRPAKRISPPLTKTSSQGLVDSKLAQAFRSDRERFEDEIKRRGHDFFTRAPKPSRFAFVNSIPPSLKRLLTPGKLFVYALVSYTGYRIYNWQTDPSRDSVLNPRYFYPFMKEFIEPVSSTSAVIKLQNYPLGQDSSLIDAAWKTGVWSVQVMQPDLQIARSYSPLPPSDPDMPPECIRLFVREEPKGEVSRMLHRQPPGTLVHMRGPYPEFEVPDGVEEVLFLAGGTGIAPALQVAHCLYRARGSKPEDLPKMRILWANRRREDSRNLLESETLQEWRANLWGRIRGFVTTSEGVKKRNVTLDGENEQSLVKQTRLVDEVEQLAASSDGKISVEYFVDEEGSFISERLLRSYLNTPKAQSASTDSKEENRLVIIAGPDGFVDHYAGPKIFEGGKERPGPLNGVLKKIDPQGWDIWTL